MTETTDTTAAPASAGSGEVGSTAPARKAGGLSSMLLPELKQLAGGLGIKATGMKKAELVAAIRAAQGGGQGRDQRNGRAEREATDPAPSRDQERAGESTRQDQRGQDQRGQDQRGQDQRGQDQQD